MPKAESPFGLVELHRRHSQVSQHAVDLTDTARGDQIGDPPVLAVHELDPIRDVGETRARPLERARIPIDSNHPSPSGHEERPRMSTQPDGAVDIHAIGSRVQEPDDLAREHRLVRRIRSRTRRACWRRHR